MNRPLPKLIAAAALAAIGTFLLVGYVSAAEDRALEGERLVNVLVASEPAAKGATVDELESSVRVERVPKKVRAADAIDSLQDVRGKVLAVDVVAGEQLLTSRFVAPEVAERGVVPEGHLETTIGLAPERAVGGRLRPGDTVAVVASFTQAAAQEGEQAGAEVTHVILHKVVVTGVQVEKVAATEDDSDEVELAPTGNLLVTLALEAPSMERLVFAAEHGSIWLSLEPSGAAVEGTRPQTRATVLQ